MHTNNSSGSITNLIILGFWQLHHQFGNLVVHIHHAKDGSSIIGDSNLAILVDHHLVKTSIKKKEKIQNQLVGTDPVGFWLTQRTVNSPFGPNDVFRVEATAFAAIIWDCKLDTFQTIYSFIIFFISRHRKSRTTTLKTKTGADHDGHEATPTSSKSTWAAVLAWVIT